MGGDASKALQPQPAENVLDINNATVWLTRRGKFGWNQDEFAASKNGSFPKGSSVGAVFAQGFLWGGKVRDGGADSIRVNGSTYNTGMAPGGIDWNPNTGEVFGPEDATNRERFHVWRVDRNWASEEVVRERAAYLNGVSNPDNVGQGAIDETREQFEYDWTNWPAEDGAPYEECNGMDGYQPADPERVQQGDTCEELDGDIPGRPGADQTMWVVTNDIGSQSPSDASEASYGSPAMGMETQFTVWGYDRPPGDALSNINFIKARLIYTGLPGGPSDARIDSMFTTWWADPDVGTFSNDFAGVDTSRSLGYAYNAGATDDSYQQEGLAPPAVGWDFFKGPETADGDTLGLTSYVYFAAGSDISDPILEDYEGTLQWYNLMRAKRPRPEYPEGDPFVNPNTGEEVLYSLPGDPVSGSGWIDGQVLPPGDRRIVNNSGPFTMEKGDTVDVVVGQVQAIGSSNLTSIQVMRFFDESAQFAFDQNFNLPSPPVSPSVSTAAFDEEVLLNWGTDAELTERIETFTAPPGFEFQGYRVYQLPSRTSSLDDGERIATFDKEDDVRALLDNVFDPQSGIVSEQPVQALPNEGIQRVFSITDDKIRDRPLANGVDYYFAVTAFGYLDSDQGVPSRILESSPTRVTVRPQRPEPGTRNIPEIGTKYDVERVGDGRGTADFSTELVDPSLVTDATYTITFGVDQNTGDGFWELERDGNTVLSQQEFGVLSDRPQVNGVKTNVFIQREEPDDPPTGYVQGGSLSPKVAPNPQTSFISGVQTEGEGLHLWGDATLFGAPTGWYSIFNPSLPSFPPAYEDAQKDLEFRFTGNGGMEQETTEGGQLATYYERGAFGAPNPQQNYDNQVIRMPFELWEVEEGQERQINFAVIGRNADGESPWGNGAGDYYRMAARDYIVPIHTEYDEQDVQNNGTSPAAAEASWLLFFVQGGSSVWETGDEYRLTFPQSLEPGSDEFQYETSGPETGVEEDLKASVDEIGVFPNPYRGFNRLEDSRFDKFVRFVHLPDPAEYGSTTIRLFTLSGNPVKVIRHTEDSPNPNFRDWDLTNQGGVPVASGIYLAHISTPVGDKTLKVAIVQEEEILRRY